MEEKKKRKNKENQFGAAGTSSLLISPAVGSASAWLTFVRSAPPYRLLLPIMPKLPF